MVLAEEDMTTSMEQEGGGGGGGGGCICTIELESSRFPSKQKQQAVCSQ